MLSKTDMMEHTEWVEKCEEQIVYKNGFKGGCMFSNGRTLCSFSGLFYMHRVT